jgi:hypothetical protein
MFHHEYFHHFSLVTLLFAEAKLIFWGTNHGKKMLRRIYLACDTGHFVSVRLSDLVCEGMENDRTEHDW